MRELADPIRAGCAYLLRRQHSDGHWEDYELPTGRSDAWVTAYVGLALTDVARRGGLCGAAAAAASSAAAWLSRHREYPAGWGYNATTGPDSDSTGYALRLLRATGGGGTPQDEAWLLTHWRPEGGFSTYAGPDGWGMPHPDVTPTAFAGLSEHARDRLRVALRSTMLASRDSDGTWPAYWWRTRHYSTYINSRLAQAAGLDIAPSPPVVTLQTNRAVHSAFDLAFVTANAALHDPHGAACRELVATLATLQGSDGCWPGASNLRVTRHDTPDPWNDPQGTLYTDVEHLITTASAVHVLAELHERWTPLK